MAGDTEAFLSKIEKLQSNLAAMQMANLMPNVTQQDLEESMTHQQRMQEQANRQKLI